MWLQLVLGSFISISALMIYVIRNNQIVKSLVTPYLNRGAILIGTNVKTLVSTIQLTGHPLGFDLVWITRQPDRIIIWTILSRTGYCLKICYPQPGTTLKYYYQDSLHALPYELGTPFNLSPDQGYVVLYKKTRKGIRFIDEELARGFSWPLLN